MGICFETDDGNEWAEASASVQKSKNDASVCSVRGQPLPAGPPLCGSDTSDAIPSSTPAHPLALSNSLRTILPYRGIP